MAKNLCAAAVMEAAQAPGLPRYLISRLQLVLARPQEQRAELLLRRAAGVGTATARGGGGLESSGGSQVFLEPALELFSGFGVAFFPVAFPSLFCLLIRFSFAIFSSHPSVLASGWETFSISLEQQLTQAFPSVLALASLFFLVRFFRALLCDAGIPLRLAISVSSLSILLLPALPWGWDLVIFSPGIGDATPFLLSTWAFPAAACGFGNRLW